MPFQSQAQRGLFYAAQHDPALAKRVGLGRSVIHDFISHDSPGKLPKHVGHALGGDVDLATHIARQPFQMGGMSDSPWWEKSEARSMDRPMYGFALGTGGGRTDKNNVSTAAGSYVQPADIVSGLGGGNSLGGALVYDKLLRVLPYGVAQMSGGRRGPGPPKAPAPFREEPSKLGIAKGGGVQKEDDHEEVPIASADGEIIMHPDQVAAIGASYLPENEAHNYRKALAFGHKILDEFVKIVRGRTIKDMKELPGPKGADEPEEGHKEAA